MQTRTDKELIANYLAGDEESLEILIKRCLRPVYNFIYKRYVGNAEEAEDIAQDVFLKMWDNLKKFDKEKSFKTWLFAIAKNSAIDFLKKKKAVPFSRFINKDGENMILETLTDPALLPDEFLKQKEAGGILKKAINKLSPKYRMVLLPRLNNGLTFREIAESLGESMDTIKSRYRRALALLKNIILQ